MPALTHRCALVALGLDLIGAATLAAQEPPAGDDVVKMEAFNVTAYNGKIPILDGFTGKDYEGSNQLVDLGKGVKAESMSVPPSGKSPLQPQR